MKNYKFTLLKKWKIFQKSISPLYFKTIINDILIQNFNVMVYALFNTEKNSIHFFKTTPETFKFKYPNYSKKDIYIIEFNQLFKSNLKTSFKNIPIKVDDLYLSNLKIKNFENHISDTLTDDEKHFLLLNISKYLPYQDWINFSIKWKIVSTKRELLFIVLKMINNTNYMEKKISFTTSQIRIFNCLLKDFSLSFWKPNDFINIQELKNHVLEFNEVIIDLCSAILQNINNPTICKQLSDILYNFWKEDLEINDFIYILRHFPSFYDQKSINLINELIDQNLLKIPLDKNFNIKEKDFKYSPYFYDFEIVDDFVPYYNVKINFLLPYCSRTVYYQYFNNLNNSQKTFNVFLNSLLKKIYKHNVHLYQDKMGNNIIEILYIYKDELNFFFNFLISNPEYMMIAFDENNRVKKIEELSKLFILKLGNYLDEKKKIENSLEEATL